MEKAFIKSELSLRYSRQMAISEIGVEGQKKILNASVLVIGCGALGSMVAMQLAGAGIGTLGICDFDTIDISNLQRQFFFKTKEAGLKKVNILGERISELNPEVKIKSFSSIITDQRAKDIFSDFDFIIDATDNPVSKKMTGEISFLTNKACCIAGVRDFTGQVITLLPYDARFEDYFGFVSDGNFLPCSISGVIGPAACISASIQASETIKYITQAGELLNGHLLFFDLLKNVFKIFNL